MITKVEFKENSELNNSEKKNRTNKNNRHRKYRKSYRKQRPENNRKYPKEVLLAFKYDYDKCDIFYKTMYGYMCGRHILEISPLYVYNLQNGINAKKASLTALFKYEDALKLNIDELSPKAINGLSELAFSMLHKGITVKLGSLDLNYFMSTDKIVNAGNVIKNHNGTEVYGGSTIRDYLTHFCINEKDSTATDEEIELAAETVKEKIAEFKSYTAIKSIPFSIFRYSLYMKTDENDKITTPDIEAKHNLKKMIGQELYSKYHFEKISMARATFFESKLIKQIRKTMTKEMNTIANELLVDIPDGNLKNHAVLASSIENVTAITDSGIIHDIVEYMTVNIKNIKSLGEPENINRTLTEQEQKSLFQIEYTAMKATQFETEKDTLWLGEISAAIKAEHATFNKLLLCIDNEYAPMINEKSILDYNIEYDVLKEFFSKHIEGKSKAVLEEEANDILSAFCEIIEVVE